MYINILTIFIVFSGILLLLGIIAENDKKDGTYQVFNGSCFTILLITIGLHIIRFFWN